MNLIIAVFAIVTVFLLLLKLFAAYTGRVSERMLTGYFRDLESLLEHNQLPVEWERQVRKLAEDEAAKPLLMTKIRGLSSYFEASPFVDSPETRTVLLEQLDAIIERWESAELTEILADYGPTVSNQRNHDAPRPVRQRPT